VPAIPHRLHSQLAAPARAPAGHAAVATPVPRHDAAAEAVAGDLAHVDADFAHAVARRTARSTDCGNCTGTK
jgi:hypothetical protein